MAITDDLYLISMAARLLDMHPQTLRKYERLGLVQPSRTLGSMRVYSHDEVERLRLIKRLVEEEGVNLAGVQRLLDVAAIAQRIQPWLEDDSLSRQELRRRLSREFDRLWDIVGL